MKNIIKLLITIAIFYVLFQHIDFQKLWHILAKSHGGWIFLALIMQLGSTYLAAYRWFKISKLLAFKESLSFYVQSYFKGTFFNQVLPSSIGGDAIRVIDLTKMNYEKKDAFYDIFIDRVIGLVGLLVLNLIASLIFYGTFPSDFSQLIIFISLAGILGFSSLFIFHNFAFLENIKVINLLHRLSKRLNEHYTSKTLLLKHISISVAVHMLTVLAIYGISLSIDAHLSFQMLLIAVPPVFLLTIVPVSLAGWGIREGAMVGIFTLVGADPAKVLAMSILYGLLLIISAIPGSYFWMKNKKYTKLNKENI